MSQSDASRTSEAEAGQLASFSPQIGHIVRVYAHAAVDAVGTSCCPARLDFRVVPGGFQRLGSGCDAPDHELHLASCVLIPALVNAHAHLDLTHIGPRPFSREEGFSRWLDLIRRERRHEDEQIAESVRRGAELSLAGGVLAIGDIAGAPAARMTMAPARALASTAMLGVSFLEFFAIGTLEGRTQMQLNERLASLEPRVGRIRVGLQPHAPYSVSLAVFQRAADEARRRGLALATHLAETLQEREFVESATGPHRAFLEAVGVWTPEVLDDVGHGMHPVDHLAEVLGRGQWLCAHVNDAPDAAIAALSEAGAHVAYCPRASEYFGNSADLGPHRYVEMIQAGINVCLGTDSIVNLPPDEASREAPDGPRISVLDDMRLLYRRDRTDPRLLLAMGTVHGAQALGLDPAGYGLGPGQVAAGLCAVGVVPDPNRSPLELVLSSRTRARLLTHPDHADL